MQNGLVLLKIKAIWVIIIVMVFLEFKTAFFV